MTNAEGEDKERSIDVYATPQEIEQLATDGYLVREGLFEGVALEALRAALDDVEAIERQEREIGTSRRFGGFFMRHLFDKHPAFLELIKFPPTLSVARAVFGPLVNVRQLGARISYPGEPNQETHWHLHRRVIPDPIPAFYTYPHTLDCLIYLDELNDETGPISIVPGTHQRIHDPIPADDYDDKPDQLTLHLSAGSCLIFHSNLWHRAGPTTPQGHKRRVLILCYGPTWMRRSPFGEQPENGLTKDLLNTADRETKELLGIGGYQ
ncbi:MAG: phytanoyl-CoA dioxygenase family protein [Chloroflexota bacterium]